MRTRGSTEAVYVALAKLVRQDSAKVPCAGAEPARDSIFGLIMITVA